MYIPPNLVGKESSEIFAVLTVSWKLTKQGRESIEISRLVYLQHIGVICYSVYCLWSKGYKKGFRFFASRLRESLILRKGQVTTQLKGLSHELDWTFDDLQGKWIAIGLNKRRAWFLYFLDVPPIFYSEINHTSSGKREFEPA